LSPYDPADAIYSAAAMLCINGAASGTAAGIRRTVFAYNHSQAYVNDVLGWAARYTIPVPSGAPATALAFALRQIGKPYQWGATSPDAYAAAGIHVAPSPSAGAKTGPTVPPHPDPARGPACQTGEDVQIDPLDLAGAVVATHPVDLPHHA
jgi:cell wall-associated NlpC family hydrolase